MPLDARARSLIIANQYASLFVGGAEREEVRAAVQRHIELAVEDGTARRGSQRIMGTKNNPGDYDCYVNAEPNEPMFILLGRDPHAGDAVRKWADDREALVKSGEKPYGDMAMVYEARRCARSMDRYHLDRSRALRRGEKWDDNSFVDPHVLMREARETADE